MSNRKYFGTDGIRGRVGDAPITPEFVLKLGWAAGKVLARHGSRKIIIGKDTRISGYMLESALEAGLAAAGLSASFTGPMPTPAIAYLTRAFRAEAGIVISASHNPFYDNGIKFFSIEGTKLPDDVEEAIEAEMEKELTCVDSAELGKASRIVDAAGRYIEFCKGTFPNELSLGTLKVVVDCAHGATYHIAPNVFRELGAQVIAMGCEPDGLNINEEVGATDVRALQARVLAEKADLGIALDGDGDNLLIVALKLAAKLTLLCLADSLAEHMFALFGGYSADLCGLDGNLNDIAGHCALLILLSLLDEQIGVGIGYLGHYGLAQINAELALVGVDIAEDDVLVVIFLFQRADEDILDALAHRVNGDAGVLAEQFHGFEELLVLLAFLVSFFFIHFPNQSF